MKIDMRTVIDGHNDRIELTNMDGDTIATMNIKDDFLAKQIINSNKEWNKLQSEKLELLKALRELNSVKSEPWTDEQAQLKLKVGFEVEDILKKYESEE